MHAVAGRHALSDGVHQLLLRRAQYEDDICRFALLVQPPGTVYACVLGFLRPENNTQSWVSQLESGLSHNQLEAR